MKCAKCGWLIPAKYLSATVCAMCVWRMEVERYAEAFKTSADYIEFKKSFMPMAILQG